LRKGAEQVLRNVHEQQADAAEDPWFADAGITGIVPLLAVDRIGPVPEEVRDDLRRSGVVLMGAGELRGTLRAGDDSWLAGAPCVVPPALGG
jgi:hypothetical protein